MLVMGVEALTEPRGEELPNPEDATTTEDAWHLLLNLDDVKWLSNKDKSAIRKFVKSAADRIKESRRECSRWDRLWNLRECQ